MNTQLHTKNLLVKAIRKAQTAIGLPKTKVTTETTDTNEIYIRVDDGSVVRYWFKVMPYEKGDHQRFKYDFLYGKRVMNDGKLFGDLFMEILHKTVFEAGYIWECENSVESIIYKERN
tara:strand:+ start:655 stop:1008 length:354 start_codon:yes stop_codon:yes gene_type:complete